MFAEVCVDFFNEVGSVLIAAVDTPFEREGFNGVDIGVADDILKMPLHGIDVAFVSQTRLDGLGGVGVCPRGVNVISFVVEGYNTVEYLVTLLGKGHSIWVG